MATRVLAQIFALAFACNSAVALEPDPALPELKLTYPTLPAFDGDLYMIFAHGDDELMALGYVARVREEFPKKPIHWILVSDSGKGWVVPFSCFGKNP